MKNDKVIDFVFELLKSKTDIKKETYKGSESTEYKFYVEDNIIVEINKNGFEDDSINTYALIKGEKYYLHFFNNSIDRVDVALDIVKRYI